MVGVYGTRGTWWHSQLCHAQLRHTRNSKRTLVTCTTLSHTALSQITFSLATVLHNRSSTISFVFPAFPIPFPRLLDIAGRGLCVFFIFQIEVQERLETDILAHQTPNLDCFFLCPACIHASISFDLVGVFPCLRPGGSADFPNAGEPKKYGMGHQGAKHVVLQGVRMLFWPLQKMAGRQA